MKKPLNKYLEKEYVNTPTVFNMSNPYHRKVFQWMYEETTNFSGFIFQTLSMRYEGASYKKPSKSDRDKNLMKGMLG